MLRLYVYLFGSLFLLCLIALGRQLAAEHLRTMARSKTLRASPEGWLLFVAAVAVAFRCFSDLVISTKMPGIASGWIWGYGVCCAIYLAVKSVRMFSTHA